MSTTDSSNEIRKEKVLIKNYDRNKKQYDLFYNELTELSIEELKEVLRDLPTKKNRPKQPYYYPLDMYPPAMVITDRYIFTESTSIKITFELNNNNTHLGLDHYPIEDIEELLDQQIEPRYKRKKWHYNYEKIGKVIAFLMVIFLPFYNSLIICLNWEQFKDSQTQYLFSILFVMSVSILVFMVYISIEPYFPLNLNKEKDDPKSTQIIPFIYTLPYEDILEPADWSIFLIACVQSVYIFIFHIYSLSYIGIDENLIISIIFCIVVVIDILLVIFLPIGLYYPYRLIKKGKEVIIRNISERLSLGSDTEKLFYQNIYLKIKKQKVVKFNVLSKGITYITVLITIYQYIS
ncbi:MAG: hypothetical protein ACFFAO_02845 [Candidatus Hermodarchaeota archaeon]